jgi:rhodanese-related sulfurtransferase
MIGRICSVVLNVVSFVCLGVLIWNYAHRSGGRSSQQVAPLRVGSDLRIPQVKWDQAPRTIVLAVSTSCPYCRASAGFYKQLIAGAVNHTVHVMALLPEPLDSAKPALSSLGIEQVADIHRVNLGMIGVRATPELLIVDRQGKVQAAWTGELAGVQEAEVFATLGITPPPHASSPAASALSEPLDYVSPHDAPAVLASRSAVIVDIRKRNSYNASHISGALNIPIDEITQRAAHELPHDQPLLIYCSATNDSGCAVRSETDGGVPTLCMAAKRILSLSGFSNVRLILTDLSLLGRYGVRISGQVCNK